MPDYTLTVNGQARNVTNVPADLPLLYVLRDLLGNPLYDTTWQLGRVTGPKYGCGVGVCGACTSHIGTNAVRLCIRSGIDPVPAGVTAAPAVGSVGSQPITTIEGLANGDQLHPIQLAWIDADVASCGYCQPGQIMTALALITANPNPTDDDIDVAMSQNVCRCGTYVKIRAAIKNAAQTMRGS